ncbi:unnamed protein product [Medioppia subpectinata]|uniref:Uncharacterized protein n=1 Tax=Medioppia subpectinata TaxID=1979941 RepID=A0A7R9L2V4_9ACAR|nr:unnamed protein product [Medioppia subpectinata]CAG2114388.1 unnamed protein product [Medioppia subpectinata]
MVMSIRSNNICGTDMPILSHWSRIHVHNAHYYRHTIGGPIHRIPGPEARDTVPNEGHDISKVSQFICHACHTGAAIAPHLSHRPE